MAGDRFPLDLLLELPPDALERLIDGWLGPTDREPEPVLSRIHLPASLVGALRVVGRRPGLFAQNRLVPADEIAPVLGLGRFLIEHDDNCFWGFAMSDAGSGDPRVWSQDVVDGRRIADARLSRFLLKATVLELVLGGEGGGTSSDPAAHGRSATDIVAGLTPLTTLGPLLWPTTAWFAAGADELAVTIVDEFGAPAWAWRSSPPRVPTAPRTTISVR